MSENDKKFDDNSEQKLFCFVIGPIGSPKTDTRRHADWVLYGLIKPVAESLGYTVQRSDEIAVPGMIDSQVINAVHTADLVIADLSRQNPNAFYELAIRHMVAKPVIHMCEENEKVPFDVGYYRTIPLALSDYHAFEETKSILRKQIEHVKENPQDVDNPVKTARGKLEVYESGNVNEKLFIDMMNEFENRLRNVELHLPANAHEKFVVDLNDPDNRFDPETTAFYDRIENLRHLGPNARAAYEGIQSTARLLAALHEKAKRQNDDNSDSNS